MDQFSGKTVCTVCGEPWWGWHSCGGTPLTIDVGPDVKVGRYQFTPHQITEADFRRIIREELERARLPPQSTALQPKND